MASEDGAQARARVEELIRQPPAGAVNLCVERYLKLPASQIPGAVVDGVMDTLLDGESASRKKPGCQVVWRDSTGNHLAMVQVDQVDGFEEALLPKLFAAITPARALSLWCQTASWSSVAVERWDGRGLLGDGNPCLSVAERSLLDELELAGRRVTREPTGATIVRETVEDRQLWILPVLVLCCGAFIWIVPILLVVSAQFRGWARSMWEQATRTRRHRTEWRVAPGRLVYRRDGDGAAVYREWSLADVVAVSVAPEGPRIGGELALRLVTAASVEFVRGGLDDVEGRTLKALVQASALRAQAAARGSE